MPEPILYILLAVALIWLITLTVSFVMFKRLLNKLTKGVKEADFKKVLSQILMVQKDNKKEFTRVNNKIKDIIQDGSLHVQKVSLVRFNPFKETGGDHSFSVAMLDGKDTGFVLTGLHTRERTRIYVKPVEKGKSNLELSSEEEKALTKAQKGG